MCGLNLAWNKPIYIPILARKSLWPHKNRSCDMCVIGMGEPTNRNKQFPGALL